MKYITITFDFEGKWGMPHKSRYDLVETTHRLLDVLDRYGVKAVFFAVGKIIEEYPDLIKEISEKGHEIAMHGYAHEHLDELTEAGLSAFSENLSRVENLLEKLTGKRPIGFRAPYLLGPCFYTPELYRILEAHKYRWVSNREIRYSDELFRPDRINTKYLVGKNNWFTRMISIALNTRLILAEKMNEKKGMARILSNIKWLNSGTPPFKRDGLLEIPIYSPLDCDLIGLPKPEENTPDNMIQYAIEVLTEGANKRGDFYSITFHDWIIGTANRMQVLDKILDNFTKNSDVAFAISPEKKL